MSDPESLQNNPEANVFVKEEGNLVTLLQNSISELSYLWENLLDFRLKLLVILVLWLFVNICLIKIAWRIYGTKVSETFVSQGTYGLYKCRIDVIDEIGVYSGEAFSLKLNRRQKL